METFKKQLEFIPTKTELPIKIERTITNLYTAEDCLARVSNNMKPVAEATDSLVSANNSLSISANFEKLKNKRGEEYSLAESFYKAIKLLS